MSMDKAKADTNCAKRTAMHRVENHTDNLKGMWARKRAADAQGLALGSEVGLIRLEVERTKREKQDLADALNVMAEEVAEERERVWVVIDERKEVLARMEGRQKEDMLHSTALKGEVAEL